MTQRIPCRCWSCRRELGTTDGEHLYLNSLASIRRPMTIWCACGGATFWRPSKKVCEKAEFLTSASV